MPTHEDYLPALAFSNRPQPRYSARTPILGNDVLRSWMDRVRNVGLQSLWLTASHHDDIAWTLPPVFAHDPIERLLLIKPNSYAEIDLADFLRFHCERENPITAAHDARGDLGVCLLDHRKLNASGKRESVCAPSDCEGMPYQFRGYAKRIVSAMERQELVRDGLTGACAMRPFGSEIREQVWIGEDVNLAESARIIGPTYIGARTIVRAGATIGPFASVERDCVVDCGTTVERSTVLPKTYLAPGILIRHALVDGRYLEDLTCGAVADLQPARLGRRVHSNTSSPKTCPIGNHVSSRAEDVLARDLAPFSAMPQPWVEVRL